MLAVLLDATIVVTGPAGEREVPAADFFLGFFTTALEPGELLVEVRFPRPRPHAALQEFARRHGDFAIVAAAVAVDIDGDRMRRRADRRRRRRRGAAADRGAERCSRAPRPAARRSPRRGASPRAAVDPSADVHGSAEYRRELTAVLVRRALAEAIHADRGSDGDGRG